MIKTWAREAGNIREFGIERYGEIKIAEYALRALSPVSVNGRYA